METGRKGGICSKLLQQDSACTFESRYGLASQFTAIKRLARLLPSLTRLSRASTVAPIQVFYRLWVCRRMRGRDYCLARVWPSEVRKSVTILSPKKGASEMSRFGLLSVSRALMREKHGRLCLRGEKE
jgi:hypothetical protein